MLRQTAPFSKFCRAIQHAERLTLLEGLPHPTWERTAFAQEFASSALRVILDSPFYEQARALDAQDDAAIRSVFANEQSFVFSPDEGRFKRCGGFHADFAIEFAGGGEAGAALICFGCGEIKTRLRAFRAHRWHHDLMPDAETALKRVLLRHRYERPIPVPPRPTPQRTEITRAEALQAVATILSDLEAYRGTHGRYPPRLSRQQRSRGQPRSVIYYQALSGGRDFWLAYSQPELDGQIVFRSDSLPSAS